MERKIEKLNKLIQFLSGIQNYQPNETDISLAGLNKKLGELKSAFGAKSPQCKGISNLEFSKLR